MTIAIIFGAVWLFGLPLAMAGWAHRLARDTRRSLRAIRRLHHYRHADWCTDIRELF
jgi:hypothetical protein